MSADEIAQHFPVAKSTLSGHSNLHKDASARHRASRLIIYGLIVSVYGAIVELLGAVTKRTPSGKRRRGDAYELAN